MGLHCKVANILCSKTTPVGMTHHADLCVCMQVMVGSEELVRRESVIPKRRQKKTVEL